MSDLRARKSGIGADIDRKLEEKYDAEEAAGTMDAVVLWINAILQGQHDTITSSSQKELWRAMGDGVLLCKLINVLLAQQGAGKVSFKKNALSPFVKMGNIQAFNDGCKLYGMKETDLFQSSDLVEGRKGPFMNVINCLSSLGFRANDNGFEPTFTGQQTKYLDNE